MSKKLIIFDCDGTLVDSQHLIVEAMEMAFHANDLEALPRDKVLSIVGLSLPLAIETLLPGKPPRVIEAVTQGYRDGFGVLRRDPANHEPLYEGILSVIEVLGKRGDTLLGVATGKSIRGVDALFERMRLQPYFATIQTADTHPSKPNPSMIETAMREVGAEPSNTVMIGDTTFDMRMAKAAGVGAIGVSWGYHPGHTLVAEGADVLLDHPDAIVAAVDGWWG